MRPSLIRPIPYSPVGDLAAFTNSGPKPNLKLLKSECDSTRNALCRQPGPGWQPVQSRDLIGTASVNVAHTSWFARMLIVIAVNLLALSQARRLGEELDVSEQREPHVEWVDWAVSANLAPRACFVLSSAALPLCLVPHSSTVPAYRVTVTAAYNTH
ncbi:hypothetical protein VTK56DRAFT_3041 [Thermocarpiscus australiensis]